MPTTFRFPLLVPTPIGPAELSQVITLASALAGVSAIPQGGLPVYASIAAWKLIAAGTETPYCDFAIEFTGTAGTTIGSGTPATEIGLYGEITGVGKFLLGVLGIPLGNPLPQIPIFSATVGYSQIVNLATLYNALSIGGVNGDINIDVGAVTVRARPIRRRSYLG